MRDGPFLGKGAGRAGKGVGKGGGGGRGGDKGGGKGRYQGGIGSGGAPKTDRGKLHGGGKGRARKGKGGQTVSRGFLTSLKKLMEALESTEAHFIRCIKPNNEVCAEVVSPRLRQPRTSSSDAPTGRPRC